MGVKSTQYITREDAIERILDLRKRIFGVDQFEDSSDKWLEDELEHLNDLYFEKEYGEYGGFDNYIITSQEEVDKFNARFDFLSEK